MCLIFPNGVIIQNSNPFSKNQNMLKSRNPLFNKTLSKQGRSLVLTEQTDPIKTRRSYFKLSKNNTNLTAIIKDLEKNVKELKNYHESLQKGKTMKLQKTTSLNEINKFRCNSKNKIKTYLRTNSKRNLNRVCEKHSNKENQCQNSKNPVIESTISKYIPQNGSTMLNIHNADVEDVKKAYTQTYGRENSNIVDLYNFFKKNVQKSTRIYGGSIQISTYPHGQHSEDLIKSRQNWMRKSNQFLNVIVEDKQQKSVPVDNSNKVDNQFSLICKNSSHKNPTIEQIFKNGCPDLANVYDFVKKRRVSLKNYMNLNKNNEKNEKNNRTNRDQQKIESQKISSKETKVQEIKQLKFQLNDNNLSSPFIGKKSSISQKSMNQEPELSQQKYLPSKSSKKSQKSSIKKSKQKEIIDLDENIRTQSINEFNQNIDKISQTGKENQNNQNEGFVQVAQENKKIMKMNEKFKHSKYYVQPVPTMKEDSLDGCQISIKSSNKIIELDFIPLDL